MENLWMSLVACAASFICGMWLRDTILNWISRG